MNQSVIKALKLLDLFIDEKDLTLSEIALKANMPKPSAYRFLSSLEAGGYLTKIKNTEQDVRYRLGIKLMELGSIVAEQIDLRTIALPWMEKLCEEINEAVHLVILDGNEAVYIEKVESSQAVRLHTRVGQRLELHIGSGPKLLLANLPDAEREKKLQNLKFSKLTLNTIENKDVLLNEIAKIQKDGYAISKGEQDEETIGISCPILDHKGKVVAALTVSGPNQRMQEKTGKESRANIQAYAAKISAQLGYRD